MTNEELEQKVKRLEEQLTEVRIELLERKAEQIPLSYLPYQVKIPDNLENYYTIDIDGSIEGLYRYTNEIRVLFYLRGLAFKTKTEAEQYLKKSMLLFKLHEWTEEHNGGWTPNWEDIKEEKWSVMYDDKNKELETYVNYKKQDFLKLPYFKTQELAEQFIEEFGDEIKEVLC